ncbi:MAG: hypothetical protein K6T85_16310 [Gorillibacterium sp.]|nr:hypothetical protein [Gorillibacterium sp.]
MSANEEFDIFDQTMQHIGMATRAEAHRVGLWHQTFQCWVLAHQADYGWSVLVQLRQKDKDVYPNLLDISCAGHLLAGEEATDGIRELKEELGIDLSFEELHSYGIIAVEHLLSETVIDREFCHVYIYQDDRLCQYYSFQKSEISGLFHVSLADFKQLMNGERESLIAVGIELNALDEGIHQVCREVQRSNFTPHSKRYYAFILDKMDHFIAQWGRIQ